MNEMLRAALVIARRDFTALIRSKAFIFFLVGPLLMFGIALAAGGVGNRIAQDTETPVIALVMSDADAGRLIQTRERLDHAVGGMPIVERASSPAPPEQLLRAGRNGRGYAAILTGSLDRPVLHASAEGVRDWSAPVRLLIATARQSGDFTTLSLDTRTISAAAATAGPDRRLTAQIGQMALFLLTMLLAGMVLSNLVEEKTNKIIEILAASVPMDSIFLGKLFAMLAMAFTGIAVWSSFGTAAALAIGTALPSLPPPAVGWPLFLLLGALYFSTAYLLLGSLFLGIGAMASTVREVQTLSMPITMAQLVIFFFASYALPHLGEPVEIMACLFPFSSPFAMLARAGQQASLWPHLAALLWQGLWTMLIIRAATTLFRRNVLKSGRQRWRRRKVFAAQSPKR
jgi:ABC-2 type transport system permease protein